MTVHTSMIHEDHTSHLAKNTLVQTTPTTSYNFHRIVYKIGSRNLDLADLRLAGLVVSTC